MPRRLVALDIDGTILGYDGALSPAVRAAVRRAAERHHVVLATGRGSGGTLGVARELGLVDNHLVIANGAARLTLDPARAEGYRVASIVSFDPRDTLEKLRAELPGAGFLIEDESFRRFASHGLPLRGINADGLAFESFDELARHRAIRVVMREVEVGHEAFGRAVRAAGLHGVEYAIGWDAWVDVQPQGITKADALEALRLDLGAAAADTVAVGDGANDLEMLRWAGRGVAMGNADDAVRAAADEVAESVENDGLVAVLDAL